MNEKDEFIEKLLYEDRIRVDAEKGEVYFTTLYQPSGDYFIKKPRKSCAKINKHRIRATTITGGRSKPVLVELARIVWIKVNGAIPDGHVIEYLDKDRSNISISNLVLTEGTKRLKGALLRMKCECGKVRLGEMCDTNDGKLFWYAYSVNDINNLMNALPEDTDLYRSIPSNVIWSVGYEDEMHHAIYLNGKRVCFCTYKDQK